MTSETLKELCEDLDGLKEKVRYSYVGANEALKAFIMAIDTEDLKVRVEQEIEDEVEKHEEEFLEKWEEEKAELEAQVEEISTKLRNNRIIQQMT